MMGSQCLKSPLELKNVKIGNEKVEEKQRIITLNFFKNTVPQFHYKYCANKNNNSTNNNNTNKNNKSTNNNNTNKNNT